MKISYEQALEAAEFAKDYLAKEGPLLLKKYQWARAFKILAKAKAKENKRLAKLKAKKQ
jgi:hypothetical protein